MAENVTTITGIWQNQCDIALQYRSSWSTNKDKRLVKDDVTIKLAQQLRRYVFIVKLFNDAVSNARWIPRVSTVPIVNRPRGGRRKEKILMYGDTFNLYDWAYSKTLFQLPRLHDVEWDGKVSIKRYGSKSLFRDWVSCLGIRLKRSLKRLITHTQGSR
jgi:hypothetical protein